MRAAACLVAALCYVAPAAAAGSATVATADLGGGVVKITVAWTSDASGNVSAHTFAVPRGELLEAKFVPGAAGVQPSDLYDVTVVDQDSVDVLNGVGANLSNATAAIKPALFTSTSVRIFVDGTQTLDVVVANAGNAKSGTVILLIGR